MLRGVWCLEVTLATPENLVRSFILWITSVCVCFPKVFSQWGIRKYKVVWSLLSPVGEGDCSGALGRLVERWGRWSPDRRGWGWVGLSAVSVPFQALLPGITGTGCFYLWTKMILFCSLAWRIKMILFFLPEDTDTVLANVSPCWLHCGNMWMSGFRTRTGCHLEEPVLHM